MRLNSIKLSGFKSFVDPTHISIPGSLVGVVGPNGCGKSNIMDAVRWVLGESRASELRGETMQDVIFNGSAARKPAGRASVELHFENNDGKITGPWSQYNEIAVKRVLTRDGQSSYFINQQPVRRKDIQDIFLGTGLGPRAYAIISQGMIAQILEAKPEELRAFVEEAAGVSRYKERRKETENRLQDTQENLNRIQDILHELHGQLEKLTVQAQIAAEYRQLQKDGELKQLQLWLLQRNESVIEEARIREQIAEQQQSLTHLNQEIYNLEIELSAIKKELEDRQSNLQNIQQNFYDASSLVIRLQAEQQFANDNHRKIQLSIAQTQQSLADWEEKLQISQVEWSSIQEKQAEFQEQLLEAQAKLEELNTQKTQLDNQKNHQKELVTHSLETCHTLEKKLQILQTENRLFGEQLSQIDARIEQIQLQKSTAEKPDDALLEQLQENCEVLQHQIETIENDYARINNELEILEYKQKEQQTQYHLEQNQLTHLKSKYSTLTEFHQQESDEQSTNQWLEKNGLTHLTNIWPKLTIQSGWESAIEIILQKRLQAFEVSQIDWLACFSKDKPPTNLVFTELPKTAHFEDLSSDLPPLHQKISSPDPAINWLLMTWLADIFLSEDLETALSLRNRLKPQQLIITRDGHQVSKFDIQFNGKNASSSWAARAIEIQSLEKQIRSQVIILENQQVVAQSLDAQRQKCREDLDNLKKVLSEKSHRLITHQSDIQKYQEAVAKFEFTLQSQQEDLESLIAQKETLLKKRLERENEFEKLDQSFAIAQESHEEQVVNLENLQQQFDQLSQHIFEAQQSKQDIEFELRSLQVLLPRCEEQIQVAKQQIDQLNEHLTTQYAELEIAHEKVSYFEELDQAVMARDEIEHSLVIARQQHEETAQLFREKETKKIQIERTKQPIYEKISALQVKEQNAQQLVEQFNEQLTQLEFDEAEILTSLPPQIKPSELKSAILSIQQQMMALGDVNLAALAELEAAKTREAFLESQSQDLRSAIDALRVAIAQIDEETRQRLSNTFNQINQYFGEIFPALFGGGQAKLVMSGDDILSTGIQVIAQPPGKKNSTIHLLSGGEKALSAIALVFAFFQLNPAPFCFLDEVDAPLDDANTERFANLVRQMSSKTQFVFISHNKIAMEMASQLIGVTMQEKGVSRVVAVDINHAKQYAMA